MPIDNLYCNQVSHNAWDTALFSHLAYWTQMERRTYGIDDNTNNAWEWALKNRAKYWKN